MFERRNKRNRIIDAFAEIAKSVPVDWEIDRITIDVSSEPPKARISTLQEWTRMAKEDYYQWDAEAKAWKFVKSY